MVMPGDVTVSEALLPRPDEALNTGRMPELLPVGDQFSCRPRGERKRTFDAIIITPRPSRTGPYRRHWLGRTE